MTELELVLVTPDYKDQYLEMIAESKEDIINCGFELTIPLSNSITFDTDIKKLTDVHKGIELKEGWVPASSYWLINKLDHKIVGVTIIRHYLTERLRFRGGHIAYYIRPSERQKGYATKMLALALEYCRGLKIDKVLITCSKGNKYSAKTIKKNGGILDSEDIENGQIFQRYWIDL